MRTPFFIGWSPRSAAPLAGFLVMLTVLVLGGAGALALALGARVGDPGGGEWLGERTVSGVILQHPYPVLVTDPDATYPEGHALLLSGAGKVGEQAEAERFAGQRVRVTGAVVKRGDIDMLLVDAVQADAAPLAGPVPTTPLGTWRVVGEICDGKCVAGVMRPGDGLSHKACANVCILGGVPPVLVTTGPVEGRRFMLMGDPDGRTLPDSFRDHVGVKRRMEGTVTRVADMLVFHTDVTRAVVP